MPVPHKLIVRLVVLFLLLGMLPAIQSPATSAQDTATYYLTKYDCAPGYDPGSGDANGAFANCVTPAVGVSFTLTSGDASYGGGTQQTNDGGSTGWGGIPLGTGYSISESLPAGYGNPWVYCEVTGNPNNPGDVQYSFFQAPGGTMDVGYTDPALAAYTKATCTWFNVPSGQGQELTPGTSVVHIEKHVCASDYDPSSSNLADYQSDCSTVHGGVQFTANNGTPNATNGDNGVAEFSGLPAGPTDIRLIESSGYIPLAVYCVERPNGQNSPALADTNKVTWTDEGNGSYKISWTLTDNHTYYCVWYDISTGYGTANVYKYYCAPDFDWSGGSFDDLLSGCPNPHANIGFVLTSSNYQQGQTTDASGFASWIDPPEGDYGLYVDEPNGYDVGRIFCGYSSQDGAPPTTWDEHDYEDGAQVHITAGQYLSCYFFDVPEANRAVYFFKYSCGPDFDWQSGGYDELAAGCTNPHAGVTFDLSNEGYAQNQTTDSNGLATWTNVPEGPLHFVEQIPEGYQIGRIFCGFSSQEGAPPEFLDEYGTADGRSWSVGSPEGPYLSAPSSMSQPRSGPCICSSTTARLISTGSTPATTIPTPPAPTRRRTSSSS
jgi:hypothetical protein